MNSLSTPSGYAILLCYGILVWSVSFIFTRKKRRSISYFLVADRKLGVFEGGFSIAATWIWAPALFIASREAYVRGIAGLFWFLIPNIACLILFSIFAVELRKKMPHGVTLSEFMAKRYSKRVQILYWIELIGLGVCSFAVQLLAGAGVLFYLTGIPFFQGTLILSGIALSYSLFSGLKASVVTDYLQMIIMIMVCLFLVPLCIAKAGGIEILRKGLGGITGEYKDLFSAKGISTAWSFGIPVTIGLLAGPFGDQSFWQRTFALKKNAVSRAFILGAFIFAVVPILLSLLGFSAAGIQLKVENAQYVNIRMIHSFLPVWASVAFVFMLLSGLASTLDSNLCAISSIAGNDFKKSDAFKSAESIQYARYGMIGMAVFSLIIANIPGLAILHLFLFYGTLRSSTLLPTIIGISGEKIKETGVFYGIICSLIIGVPLFTYGKLTDQPHIFVAGSIVTVALSGIIAVIGTCIKSEKQIKQTALTFLKSSGLSQIFFHSEEVKK